MEKYHLYNRTTSNLPYRVCHCGKMTAFIFYNRGDTAGHSELMIARGSYRLHVQIAVANPRCNRKL